MVSLCAVSDLLGSEAVSPLEYVDLAPKPGPTTFEFEEGTAVTIGPALPPGFLPLTPPPLTAPAPLPLPVYLTPLRKLLEKGNASYFDDELEARPELLQRVDIYRAHTIFVPINDAWAPAGRRIQ